MKVQYCVVTLWLIVIVEGFFKREFFNGAWDLRRSYDFIIVGAGSAGSVLANRLSENPNWEILLIEAGRDEDLIQDIPMIVSYFQVSDKNWYDVSEPSNEYCLSMNNNSCFLPHGKGMGGSSSINYMIWTRGNSKDYDNWDYNLGNPGWNYNNVSKYFRKIENSLVEDRDLGFAGTSGPVKINYAEYRTRVAQSFVDAGIETGDQMTDYNGDEQLGFSLMQTTTHKGLRVSANKAYINPVWSRRNLHIKKNCLCVKVLLDSLTKRVFGVQIDLNGILYKVKATKEVILSAGAMNTPQILMLSGIGPSEHLISKNIEPLVDLPVGYNFQDHVAPGGISILVNTSTLTLNSLLNVRTVSQFLLNEKGPLTSNGGAEGISFHDTNPIVNNGWPDLELLLVGLSFSSDQICKTIFNIKESTYDYMYGDLLANFAETGMVCPMISRPKSRGRILLKSNKYLDKPVIVPNYFAFAEDIRIVIAGIRKYQQLIATEAMQKIGAKLITTPVPGCERILFDTDEYWECYMRHLTFSIWHYCGTAKMGPANDPTSVVDARLKVHGIKGLRVADASIMPEIPVAHLNAPTMMIGEKASDMIKEDWNYI